MNCRFCALQVISRMRCRYETCFELRWREIDAAFETSMKKSCESSQIAAPRAGEIGDRSLREKQAEHRTNPVKGRLGFRTLDGTPREVAALRANFSQQFPSVDAFEL